MSALRATPTPVAQDPVAAAMATARNAANEEIDLLLEEMAAVRERAMRIAGYGDLIAPRVRDIIGRAGADLAARSAEVKALTHRS